MDLFSDSFALPRCVSISRDARHKIIENRAIGGIDILLDGAELQFSEDFFGKKLSDRMLSYLQENDNFDWRDVNWTLLTSEDLSDINFKYIKWKQDFIKFFGKTHPLPRWTSWYGDPGASYAYSGIKSVPNPWNEGLLFVKEKIERALGENFNSVLLNWYRGGSDSLNWHADDEPELGAEPVIASANFGAPRDFLFRKKNNPKEKLSVKLAHGSLLVMRGKTQENWVHSVPKRSGPLSSRFNLTFRYIRDLSHL